MKITRQCDSKRKINSSLLIFFSPWLWQTPAGHSNFIMIIVNRNFPDENFT